MDSQESSQSIREKAIANIIKGGIMLVIGIIAAVLAICCRCRRIGRRCELRTSKTNLPPSIQNVPYQNELYPPIPLPAPPSMTREQPQWSTVKIH